MARRTVLLGSTTLWFIVSCTGTPAQSDASAAKPVATAFAFEPTVRQYAPQELELRILAEVGNASEATLDVVLASHDPGRTPALRVELWTFDQRDKAKLEPKGPPIWLLPLSAGEAPTGREARGRLKTALSLPNSVKTRPVGRPVAGPAEALAELGKATQTLAGSPDVGAQLAAVETLFVGVDDDVVLDERAWLKLLAAGAAKELSDATIDEASSRRATASAGALKLKLLRNTAGWVVTAVE